MSLICKKDGMSVFDEYITNSITRRNYLGSFNRFLKFLKHKDSSYVYSTTNEEAYELLKQYILYLRDRSEKGKYKVNCIRSELRGIEHFFIYNDKVINYKKLHKTIPENVKASGDKAYTKEDIRAMLNATTNPRNKFTILAFSSTGMRVGAFQELKLKHIQPIEDCYCVTIYPDSKQEYYGFFTPETSKAYEYYLQSRKTRGEVLTHESPLLKSNYGKTEVNELKTNSLVLRINRIVQKSGIPRIKTNTRYDKQCDHAFRKFFATAIKLNPNISNSTSERLLGHQNYLDRSYFLAEMENMFAEFKKAIPSLTIDPTEIQKEEIRKLREEKTDFDKIKEEKQMLEDKVARQEQTLETILKKFEKLENRERF